MEKIPEVRKYDFVLSFAGEDRTIVEQVRDVLKENGLVVFYDKDEQYELLGKDLAEHFSVLYQDCASYCVVFISRNYLDKAWCQWERRAALARAFKSKSEYLIPYYLDDSTLEAIPVTIGGAHLRNSPPRVFADDLVKKFFAVARLPKSLRPEQGSLFPSTILSSIGDGKYAAGKESAKTGYYSLDNKLQHPLRRGMLYIVGGRPSMGKTTFVLNVVSRNIKKGIPCIYACFSETPQALTLRLVALRTKVDVHKIRTDFINDDERRLCREALDEIRRQPLHFVYGGDDPQFDQFLCELWRVGKNMQPGLIVVDHLQAFRTNDFFRTNRQIGPKTVARALRWVAEQCNCACIVTSGLIRRCESRSTHQPYVEDLQGGKSLSEEAHTIFLLYRPEYYMPTKENMGAMEITVVEPGRKSSAPLEFNFEKDWLEIRDYID